MPTSDSSFPISSYISRDQGVVQHIYANIAWPSVE